METWTVLHVLQPTCPHFLMSFPHSGLLNPSMESPPPSSVPLQSSSCKPLLLSLYPVIDFQQYLQKHSAAPSDLLCSVPESSSKQMFHLLFSSLAWNHTFCSQRFISDLSVTSTILYQKICCVIHQLFSSVVSTPLHVSLFCEHWFDFSFILQVSPHFLRYFDLSKTWLQVSVHSVLKKSIFLTLDSVGNWSLV